MCIDQVLNDTGKGQNEPMQSTTGTEQIRILNVPGITNLRDVGGYPAGNGALTKWGTLLRCGTMNGLSPDARQTLHGYAIRTVLDLRRDAELHIDPQPDIGNGNESVSYRQISLLTDDIEAARREHGYLLPDIYRAILDQARDQVGQAVAALAEPGALPALVRCTAGKDRTGIIIALLLRTAGVPDETIVYDYALSQKSMETPEFIAFQKTHVLARGTDWETYRSNFLISPDKFMRDALAYIDSTYGSTCGYLLKAGVDLSAQNYLRRTLVQPRGR